MGYVLIGIGLVVIGLALFSRQRGSPAWRFRLVNGLLITILAIFYLWKYG